MKRIAELRKEKGLNQTGLAIKLNVSQKMISAYENGTHQPSIDTLIRLSKIFNVSVDYIIGESNIKLCAEAFLNAKLSGDEIQLLDMFRQLNTSDKQRAIGIMFALKNYGINL